MNFENPKSPELQEKLKSAKTDAELAALAEEEGLELADERLENVAGGWPQIQTPLPPMPEGQIIV